MCCCKQTCCWRLTFFGMLSRYSNPERNRNPRIWRWMDPFDDKLWSSSGTQFLGVVTHHRFEIKIRLYIHDVTKTETWDGWCHSPICIFIRLFGLPRKYHPSTRNSWNKTNEVENTVAAKSSPWRFHGREFLELDEAQELTGDRESLVQIYEGSMASVHMHQWWNKRRKIARILCSISLILS